MNNLGFFRQFVRAPGKVGAVIASTRRLASVMIDEARIDDATTIIELGTGTGACTQVILERLPQDVRFLALEINPDFAAATRKRCPDATVLNDDARNARKHLESIGENGCDAVLSGLPWAAFDETTQDELLDVIAGILRPGGRFVTFAYLQGLLLPAGQRFRAKLARHFDQVHSSETVWLNLPPAFVYVAARNRAS